MPYTDQLHDEINRLEAENKTLQDQLKETRKEKSSLTIKNAFLLNEFNTVSEKMRIIPLNFKDWVLLRKEIIELTESTKETPLTYKQLCERDERETADKAENEKPYFKVYINWRVWVLVAIVAVIVTPIVFVIYKLIA